MVTMNDSLKLIGFDVEPNSLKGAKNLKIKSKLLQTFYKDMTKQQQHRRLEHPIDCTFCLLIRVLTCTSTSKAVRLTWLP